MQLCSDGHEEVCYEGRICPACDAIEEKNSLEVELRDEIDTLTRECGQLEADKEQLRIEVEELKDE